MVLSTSEYEFAERLNEQRIWSPKYLPRAREVPWIGKPVTVRWMPPTLMRCGTMYLHDSKGLGKAEPVFSIKWYGYVVELARQVDGEELRPMKETQMRNLTRAEIKAKVLKIIAEQEAHYIDQMEGRGADEFFASEFAAQACAYLRERIVKEVRL